MFDIRRGIYSMRDRGTDSFDLYLVICDAEACKPYLTAFQPGASGFVYARRVPEYEIGKKII